VTLHPSIAAVRLPVRRALSVLEPGDVVAVACSGGADSLALASAAVFEGQKLGLRVVGVTVDHGLQPGSDAQADRVIAQLAALGVDETLTACVRVDTAAGTGPEAAAREARYAVLEQVAEHLGARAVLLGHTLDDQAETVLLGLARGSGGRSLQGMRPGFGVFVRPLLGVRRDDTVTACQVQGLDAWDDPHNHDPGYTRVRVLERVLPDGAEIEFDLLETGGAWKIVETQRDIAWAATPQPVRDAAVKAVPKVAPVRVIESTQDDGTVIYELFAEGQPKTPSLEVSWKKGGTAKVLTEVWPH